jgi:hypothetical protein
VRNRFPLTTSLKQLEDVLKEEWCNILLETVPRRIAAVLKAKVLQCHINKEMCIVSVAFPLFC